MSQWNRCFSVRCKIIHQLCIDCVSDIWTCNSSSSLILCLWSKCHLEEEILFMNCTPRAGLCYKPGEGKNVWLQTTVSLESWTYQMCRNMVIKGQQLRWELKRWVEVAWLPCQTEVEWVFSAWRWKALLGRCAKHLRISLGAFQKTFLKKVK